MRLLINEPPLQVQPSLAAALKSLDEAVILQQLHYWLQKSANIRDGHRWVYNSMADWMKQFPWINSRSTITKYFDDLEKRGLIVTANYNKAKFDRTKWYRIDYDALSKFEQRLYRNCTTSDQDLDNPKSKDCTTNTNRLPETTSETTTHSASPSNAPSVSQLQDEFEELWKEYPNKKGKKEAFNHYKSWRKASKKHTKEYILAHLAAYKKYCEENADWYHPQNGSTWFNGRFDDDYTTNDSTTSSSNFVIQDDGHNPLDGVNEDDLPF
jgi:hypothetical protein